VPDHSEARASYEALFEIGMEIQAQEPRLEAVLDLVVRKARELIGADLGWMALLRGDEFVMAATDGVTTAAFREMVALPRDRGVGGATISDMRPVVISDYESHEHSTDPRVREAVIGEGLVSSLSVPMATRGQIIGVLHVAGRLHTDYTESQAALLSALAAQASIAIGNARLYADLDERNRMLERSYAIHRELTAAGLAGVGLTGLGDRVAALLDAAVMLTQDVVAPHVMSWRLVDGEAVAPGIEAPLLAGAEELGTLRLPGTDALDPLQQMALEQAQTVIALELAKLRLVRDVEWRLRGELLEELLEHDDEVPARLRERAELLGVDLSREHRILAIAVDRESPALAGTLLTTVRSTVAARQPGPFLSVKHGSMVVVALREQDGITTTIANAIVVAGRRTGSRCSLGISAPHLAPAIAFREARACLRLAQTIGSGERILTFERVGPLRFLLDASEPEQAVRLVIEELGPFLAYDRTARTPLLPTLRAYIEADGHQVTVAERCFIHVSTVKYRLGQINALLDEPLSSPAVRFRLRLAFQVRDLLQALGVSGLGEG
jgi:DNA-binding PucR family transcriptional regulator